MKVKLTKSQLSSIAKAGGGSITTKVTVRDASGTHTRTTVTKIKASTPKAKKPSKKS